MDSRLIFNEGTPAEQIVSIPILNDICLEEEFEYFTVAASSDMDCVNIVDGEVTININDDDCELFLKLKIPITQYTAFYSCQDLTG